MKQHKESTYLINHAYDIGYTGVYISSEFNPTDAAVYLQFRAEELFNEHVSLSNLAVANALVCLYGCSCGPEDDKAVVVDMYIEREIRSRPKWLSNIKGYLAPEIQRTDSELINFLKPHVADQL